MFVTVQNLKLYTKIKFIEILLESLARDYYFAVKIVHSKVTVFKCQIIGRKNVSYMKC